MKYQISDAKSSTNVETQAYQIMTQGIDHELRHMKSR